MGIKANDLDIFPDPCRSLTVGRNEKQFLWQSSYIESWLIQKSFIKENLNLREEVSKGLGCKVYGVGKNPLLAEDGLRFCGELW